MANWKIRFNPKLLRHCGMQRAINRMQLGGGLSREKKTQKEKK